MNISLHIEHLILEGFAENLDSEQLQQAIQQELTRLLAEYGIEGELATGGNFDRRFAEPIMQTATQTQALGGQIAGSIYSSFGASADTGGAKGH
jgi:hypothetical protein